MQPSNPNNYGGDAPDKAAKNGWKSKIFIRRMRHDSSLKRATTDRRNIYEVGCVTCVDSRYMKNLRT